MLWHKLQIFQDGTTVLHIAAYGGHTDLVRYFCVKKKADVNVQDQVG